MRKYEAKRTCHKCNGVGIWFKNTLEGDVAVDPCPVCNGEKYVSTGTFQFFMPGAFCSCDVYDAIDQTEYAALGDAQKAYIDNMLACGTIYLNTGSRARTILQQLFGPGTTTRANLLALIG